MIVEVLLSIAFFSLLGLAYVKGYDAVKKRSAEHLPHFYLIMAVIRMLLVGTVVAIYVLASENRDHSIRFALMFIMMYVVMMVVTLKLRH